MWNYSDFIYIWSSMFNIGIQNLLSPFATLARYNMILVIFMLLLKTFFFLRIFESLSYIVTMMVCVIYDLRIFLLFYGILTLLFSLIIGILGIGNFAQDSEFSRSEDPDEMEYFGREYKTIGLFAGNIMQTLRISMGDYDFEGADYLTPGENRIYWICWFLIVVVTCIVFLNFIIAEASTSYQNVMD